MAPLLYVLHCDYSVCFPKHSPSSASGSSTHTLVVPPSLKDGDLTGPGGGSLVEALQTPQVARVQASSIEEWPCLPHTSLACFLVYTKSPKPSKLKKKIEVKRLQRGPGISPPPPPSYCENTHRGMFVPDSILLAPGHNILFQNTETGNYTFAVCILIKINKNTNLLKFFLFLFLVVLSVFCKGIK